MKKTILLILCVFSIFIFIGCKNEKKEERITDFEIDVATDVGKNYMQSLSQENNEGIKAYFLERVSEAANNVILKYHVIRSKENDINIDLDEINLKVIKDEAGYKVSEASAKNLIQVYAEGNAIRIRNEDTATSNLLIRDKDFPVEVYIKNNEIALQKEEGKVNDFEMVALSMNGKNIGIIANSNEKYLITLVQVEDTIETIGTDDQGGSDSGGSGGNGSNALNEEDLEEIMEKPIAKKIVTYDLISVSKIEGLLFSDDGGYLIVQTSNGESSTVEIYKNPDGEKIDMNLEEIFPPERYSLSVKLINEEGNFFDVRAIGDEDNEAGVYKFDFKTKKIMEEDK